MWEVILNDDFATWLRLLDPELREAILGHVGLLRTEGPQLGRPHVDHVKGSTYPNLKELRLKHRGAPYRVLFAFDPSRQAILLVGGNKGGDKRWYEIHIPIADKRYRAHLESLEA